MSDEATSANYELEPVSDVSTDLDPRLQKTILRYRKRIPMCARSAAGSCVDVPLIEVTAWLWDPAKPVPGLNVRTIAGDIVTGTVRADQIETVRQNVRSLKEAR